MEQRAKAVKAFVDEQPEAIERVKVPKSSMRVAALRPPLPAAIASMPIDVKFPADNEATLSSLVTTLSAVNLQVAFQWSDPTQGEDILKQKLPFLSYEGTVGELMSTLRTGLGLVTWYENGTIYISNHERYAITLPQNKDVIEAVKGEIEKLGADNVVTSLRGGKIIYTASPNSQDHIIGPFLDRMTRNLAVVNMQVAVVSLALNDKSDVGFDWNKFQLAFDQTPKGINELTGSAAAARASGTSQIYNPVNNGGTGSGTGTGTGTGTDTSSGGGAAGSTDADLVGAAGKLTTAGLTLSKTNLGNVFGTYGALTVAGALNFLSNFGTTNVTQNVSLRTLSGSTMKLQSGQEVPYVKGVSNSSTSNSNNIYGSTETDKVDTGLTVEMSPLYDSDAQIVTVDVDVKLDAILDFVELSAGNQIGSITQPLVQKQNMNDIVRVQAGKTVVIGGLQFDSDTKAGTEPSMLRKQLQGTNKVGGSRSQTVQRNALFIIMRPTVTVYEAED